jgi:hypothetical protein
MQVSVKRSRSQVKVGPPGGPSVSIPRSVTIEVTESIPYDLTLVLEWRETERRLTLNQLTISSLEDGEPVRMANVIRVAIAELIGRTLEGEILDEFGWAGVVADHPDTDPIRVDALIYLLSVALGDRRPSATVARARGLSPATGPKRVAAARQAGLIPTTEPGRASASIALTSNGGSNGYPKELDALNSRASRKGRQE